jgi:RHS repeat-associated protein
LTHERCGPCSASADSARYYPNDPRKQHKVRNSGCAWRRRAATRVGLGAQYSDPETGLQYLRARYYDPSTGQFLTRDPLETQTGEPYAYAGDSPLNNTDPSGQDWLGISWLPTPGDVLNALNRIRDYQAEINAYGERTPDMRAPCVLQRVGGCLREGVARRYG